MYAWHAKNIWILWNLLKHFKVQHSPRGYFSLPLTLSFTWTHGCKQLGLILCSYYLTLSCMCYVYAPFYMHTQIHIPFGKEDCEECSPGVSSRQIWRKRCHTHACAHVHAHTHFTSISHPSSKPQCWQAYLVNRTKHQSLSIYIPLLHPSFLLPFSHFSSFYFIYLRPHSITDSAPGSSLGCVSICVRCVCSCVYLHNPKVKSSEYLRLCLHTHMKTRVDRCESMMWRCVTFPEGLMVVCGCVCLCVWVCVWLSTAWLLKFKINIWRKMVVISEAGETFSFTPP